MSHGTIDFETTILSGLPIRVTASIHPAEPDVGIMHSYSEDICIYWITHGKDLEVPKSIYDKIDKSKHETDTLEEKVMEEFYETRRER